MSSEGNGELSSCSIDIPLPETPGAIHKSVPARQSVTANNLFTMFSSVCPALRYEIARTARTDMADVRYSNASRLMAQGPPFRRSLFWPGPEDRFFCVALSPLCTLAPSLLSERGAISPGSAG